MPSVCANAVTSQLNSRGTSGNKLGKTGWALTGGTQKRVSNKLQYKGSIESKDTKGLRIDIRRTNQRIEIKGLQNKGSTVAKIPRSGKNCIGDETVP